MAPSEHRLNHDGLRDVGNFRRLSRNPLADSLMGPRLVEVALVRLCPPHFVRTPRRDLWIVRLLTLMPSLSNSPRMLSAPYRRFRLAISRIRSKVSALRRGRFPDLDLWTFRKAQGIALENLRTDVQSGPVNATCQWPVC
jgi:hypothetical protein